MRVALCAELVGLLRRHRQSVPNTPDARVFPRVPNRATFNVDRGNAMIVPKLGDGVFGAHSLRKWLSTELDRSGCTAGVRYKIMRHAGNITEDRYTRTDLEDEIRAVNALPTLWPASLPVPEIFSRIDEKAIDLTPVAPDAGGVKTEPMNRLPSHHDSLRAPCGDGAAGLDNMPVRRGGPATGRENGCISGRNQISTLSVVGNDNGQTRAATDGCAEGIDQNSLDDANGPGPDSLPALGHASPRQPERKTGASDFATNPTGPVGLMGGEAGANAVRARSGGHTCEGEAGPQTGSLLSGGPDALRRLPELWTEPGLLEGVRLQVSLPGGSGEVGRDVVRVGPEHGRGRGQIGAERRESPGDTGRPCSGPTGRRPALRDQDEAQGFLTNPCALETVRPPQVALLVPCGSESFLASTNDRGQSNAALPVGSAARFDGAPAGVGPATEALVVGSKPREQATGEGDRSAHTPSKRSCEERAAAPSLSTSQESHDAPTESPADGSRCADWRGGGTVRSDRLSQGPSLRLDAVDGRAVPQDPPTIGSLPAGSVAGRRNPEQAPDQAASPADALTPTEKAGVLRKLATADADTFRKIIGLLALGALICGAKVAAQREYAR